MNAQILTLVGISLPWMKARTLSTPISAILCLACLVALPMWGRMVTASHCSRG